MKNNFAINNSTDGGRLIWHFHDKAKHVTRVTCSGRKLDTPYTSFRGSLLLHQLQYLIMSASKFTTVHSDDPYSANLTEESSDKLKSK